MAQMVIAVRKAVSKAKHTNIRGGLPGCYCSAKTGYHGILYQALAINFYFAIVNCDLPRHCRLVKVTNLGKLLNQHNDIAVQ